MIQDTGLNQIKVLIIDDSAFIRQTIKELLEKSPDVEVVGVAVDGYDGMTKILKYNPDVVTLDLEMPRMDGFVLLRWIMEERPLPVIIVSSYGDTATVFKALELGAVDFVVKPARKTPEELKEIEKNLLNKVLGVRSLDIKKYKKTLSRLEDAKVMERIKVFPHHGEIEMVAIGASTGGPTAIQTILTRLPENFQSKVIISQHMPKGFTKQFAERMNRLAALKVKEAEHGEPVENGKVLICPGGCHMVLGKAGQGVSVLLKDPSSNDRYVPSIDIMMKSAAGIYGSKAMGVILTGMGSDGKEGMLEIKNKGGYTVAESEESSVIFGMPQAVIQASAADKVIHLENIAEEIVVKAKGGVESQK